MSASAKFWCRSGKDRASAKVCEMLGVVPGDGYRAITNAGKHGMQEVPHYHLHILGGKVLGPLIQR